MVTTNWFSLVANACLICRVFKSGYSLSNDCNATPGNCSSLTATQMAFIFPYLSPLFPWYSKSFCLLRIWGFKLTLIFSVISCKKVTVPHSSCQLFMKSHSSSGSFCAPVFFVWNQNIFHASAWTWIHVWVLPERKSPTDSGRWKAKIKKHAFRFWSHSENHSTNNFFLSLQWSAPTSGVEQGTLSLKMLLHASDRELGKNCAQTQGTFCLSRTWTFQKQEKEPMGMSRSCFGQAK